MQINLTEQELLSVIAVVGNTSTTGSILYEAYLKLQECGIDEFGKDFNDKVDKVERILEDTAPFEYDAAVEAKIKELANEST